MTKVYLLPHATEERFKIGKSINPLTRWKRFNEPVKLDKIVIYQCGKKSSAIEYWLHVEFKKWRLIATSNKDGATEWFNIECWDQCCESINQTHKRIKKLMRKGEIPNDPLFK